MAEAPETRPEATAAAELTNSSSPAPAAKESPTAAVSTPAPAPVEIPKELWLDELNAAPLHELLERAEAMHLRINADKTRHHIVFELVKAYASKGAEIYADGILELSQQGTGMLRWPRFNFRSLPQDIFVPVQVERQFSLRNGNQLTCKALRILRSTWNRPQSNAKSFRDRSLSHFLIEGEIKRNS